MPPLSLRIAMQFLGILRTRRSSNIIQTSPRSHRKRTRRKPYNDLNLIAVTSHMLSRRDHAKPGRYAGRAKRRNGLIFLPSDKYSRTRRLVLRSIVEEPVRSCCT